MALYSGRIPVAQKPYVFLGGCWESVVSLHSLVLLEHSFRNLFLFKVKQGKVAWKGWDWCLKFCECMSSILNSVLLILAYLVLPMIIACVFTWV